MLTKVHGYGHAVNRAISRVYKEVRAHRLSYRVHVDPDFDSELIVRHKCSNKACCNPNHLELGTQQDNIDDKVRDGTMARGIKQGHAKMTEATVLEARARYATGLYSIYGLAKLYGINHTTMTDIIRRKHWTHI